MATANSQNTRNAVTSVGSGLQGVQGPIATAIRDSTGNPVTVRGTGPLRAQGPLAGAPRGATLGYNDPPALRRTFDEPEQPRAPFIHPGEVEAEHDDPLTEDGWPTEGYDETSYFPHDGEEEEYNPFEGIQGLEGCSLTGLGSALPKQRTVVTPTERQLAPGERRCSHGPPIQSRHP